MHNTIIDVNDYREEITKLQRASWEKDCREQLLAFLVNQNLTSSEGYQRLWEEYLIACRDFQTERTMFFNKVVAQFFDSTKYKFWNIQYEEGTLTLT